MSGDEVTTLFVNFEWRRLISEALQLYFDNRIYKLQDADFEDAHNKFQALINDLYTPDVTSMRIGAKVKIGGNQTILAASGDHFVQFAVVEFDTHGFFNAGLDNTKLIVPAGYGGLYLASCGGRNSNIAGNRTMKIFAGALPIAISSEIAETLHADAISVPIVLTDGGDIRMSVSSTTNSTLHADANSSAWLSLVRISE